MFIHRATTREQLFFSRIFKPYYMFEQAKKFVSNCLITTVYPVPSSNVYDYYQSLSIDDGKMSVLYNYILHGYI